MCTNRFLAKPCTAKFRKEHFWHPATWVIEHPKAQTGRTLLYHMQEHCKRSYTPGRFPMEHAVEQQLPGIHPRNTTESQSLELSSDRSVSTKHLPRDTRTSFHKANKKWDLENSLLKVPGNKSAEVLCADFPLLLFLLIQAPTKPLQIYIFPEHSYYKKKKKSHNLITDIFFKLRLFTVWVTPKKFTQISGSKCFD